MRYLFFGNGYITKSLCKHYKEEPEIIIFSKALSYSKYRQFIFDINYNKQLDFTFENEDVLIYTIALKTPGSSYSTNDIDKELEALMNFIDMVKPQKVGRVILISSASVYGFNDEPFNEKSLYNPQNSYGKLKVEMENNFLNKMGNSNLPFNVFRISNVNGSIPSKQGVINLVLFSVKNKNQIKINNGDVDVRDFIYDMDLSRIFFELVESNPTSLIYNLSSFRGTKIIDLIKMIINLNPSFKDKVEFLEFNRPTSISILDNSLIKGELTNFYIEQFETSIKEILNEV